MIDPEQDQTDPLYLVLNAVNVEFMWHPFVNYRMLIRF